MSEYEGFAFLDRDGVIIKEKNYIKNPNDVELIPGIKKVIQYLNTVNYKIIIITNQSGIERKYFGWDEYLSVTEQMIYLLEKVFKLIQYMHVEQLVQKKMFLEKARYRNDFQGWSKGSNSNQKLYFNRR